MSILFKKIGIIHTPFKSPQGMPIQPSSATSIRGTINIFPEYSQGLKDLDGFSHIILLFYFHKVTKASLIVTPFLDNEPRGVFATRAPKRPNPIGLSIVKLLGIKELILEVENIDILDNTPLLDIKPYVPEFDQYSVNKIGWLEKAKKIIEKTKSDDRFIK
ncbi:MAG: tRNA (N6-threonylcarbamoyladenosine(37)-N6)-methyltransferase TrmO [Deltaproteobacteria bacterium]|nr:tRNA (N6-threonylcarbamoyladenosine(37)-N6)-methyltransferase TrmO [Deltaproteobacteria bacterium]